LGDAKKKRNYLFNARESRGKKKKGRRKIPSPLSAFGAGRVRTFLRHPLSTMLPLLKRKGEEEGDKYLLDRPFVNRPSAENKKEKKKKSCSAPSTTKTKGGREELERLRRETTKWRDKEIQDGYCSPRSRKKEQKRKGEKGDALPRRPTPTCVCLRLSVVETRRGGRERKTSLGRTCESFGHNWSSTGGAEKKGKRSIHVFVELCSTNHSITNSPQTVHGRVRGRKRRGPMLGFETDSRY